MERIRHLVLTMLLFIVSISAQAQNEVEMADTMRSNGKIYVVVGVILIVLVGLFIYMFSIERKVKNLERKIEDNR